MSQFTSPSTQSRAFPVGPKTLILGATALIAYGLSRRSKAGTALAAAGGLLVYKAATTSTSDAPTHVVFLVNASPEQAYKVWRNFSGLPRFMVHLQSVRELDDRQSEWAMALPGQREIRWTAEITEDTRNERIAWRSLPGSDVQTTGSVSFRVDPQGRGTFVTVDLQYGVPGGRFGSGLAALLGKNPEFVVREDVRRFKQLLETGEVPTTRGQTHGPRGVHGHVLQAVLREKSNLPNPQFPRAQTQSA